MSAQEAYVSAWTEIDKVIAKQGEWIFNGGANDGLVKVSELTDKINALENEINDLKT